MFLIVDFDVFEFKVFFGKFVYCDSGFVFENVNYIIIVFIYGFGFYSGWLCFIYCLILLDWLIVLVSFVFVFVEVVK